jgi:hypothetical protein
VLEIVDLGQTRPAGDKDEPRVTRIVH